MYKGEKSNCGGGTKPLEEEEGSILGGAVIIKRRRKKRRKTPEAKPPSFSLLREEKASYSSPLSRCSHPHSQEKGKGGRRRHTDTKKEASSAPFLIPGTFLLFFLPTLRTGGVRETDVEEEGKKKDISKKPLPPLLREKKTPKMLRHVGFLLGALSLLEIMQPCE